MDRNDKMIDPDEHIDVYTTHMSFYTSNNVVMCRVFPASLKDEALSWFTLLPTHIECFDTLTVKFGTQFATSRPHHLTSIVLVNIR